MSGEAITVARPYAEAVFRKAEEDGTLDAWSEMLALLAALAEEPVLAGVIANPLYVRGQLAQLIQDIAGERLSTEGGNLVRLLAENGRLPVLPEIQALYEELKAESQRTLNVTVRSAYELASKQEQDLAAALSEKLGRKVTISSEQDPELIGGVHIRAGDLVIDGSVKGRLEQLANELGI